VKKNPLFKNLDYICGNKKQKQVIFFNFNLSTMQNLHLLIPVFSGIITLVSLTALFIKAKY